MSISTGGKVQSLQRSIDDASNAFVNSVEAVIPSSSSTQQQSQFNDMISECLDHTNHMEAALASSGPFVASLERDVLPDILENAEKLEDLFTAIDVMNEELLPQVELAISRMEDKAKQLENERLSLEPSKLKQMISYFGSRKPVSHEPRPLWKDPEIFDVDELMSRIRLNEDQQESKSASSFPMPVAEEIGLTNTQLGIHDLEERRASGATSSSLTLSSLPPLPPPIPCEVNMTSSINNDIPPTISKSPQEDDDDDDVEVI